MSGRSALLLFVLLGSILGVYFFAIEYRGRDEMLADDDADSTEEGAAWGLVEVPLLLGTKESRVFPEYRLTTTIEYPEVELTKNRELAREASLVIKTFVDELVGEFTQDIMAEPITTPSEEPVSDFVLAWSPLITSPSFISIRFDYSAYASGAAHPDNRTRVFNYSLPKHTMLTTEDLFASSTTALSFLSTYTEDSLREKFAELDPDEFSVQVSPGIVGTSENFREVGVMKDGLLVIFNPYQVAPYARGTIAVPIPLSGLEGLLSTQIREAIVLGNTNIREATEE